MDERLETEKMLFTKILRIRRVEERISDLYTKGCITMPVHLSIGQEGIAAGVISSLESDDLVFSTHRCHGHYIAKGGSLKKMFAELYGSIEGCALGMGGTMHLHDELVGMKLSVPIVGASIAMGVGAALARKLRGDERIVAVFFGDGAVEEGIFWESINFAAVHKLPVLFCCENNFYATHSPIHQRQPSPDIYQRIASFMPAFHLPNGNDAEAVYRAAKEAVAIVSERSPVFLEAKTYRMREHWGVGEDWHLGYRTKEEAGQWRDPLEVLQNRLAIYENPSWFEEIEREVEEEISEAVSFAETSRLLKKPSRIEINLQFSLGETTHDTEETDIRCSYQEAAGQALLEAMEADSSVFLLGEGVDGVTGVYGHVLACQKRFPTRVIDTPLSENGLTGIAIGAALSGMRPVLIHQRNDFMLLAMDQMMNQAAKIFPLSGGTHFVPLTILSFVARKPGEGGQHSQSLHSVFSHFPGIGVGMPASPCDAREMLLKAIMSNIPTIILEHRELFTEYGNIKPEIWKKFSPFSAAVSEGSDVTVIAFSAGVRDALKARMILAKENISIEVVDIRWVRPLDTGTIIASVKKTGRAVVVDIGWPQCGIGAEIISMIAENALSSLASAPIRIAMHDTVCPASPHVRGYHPTVSDIVSAIRRSLASTRE